MTYSIIFLIHLILLLRSFDQLVIRNTIDYSRNTNNYSRSVTLSHFNCILIVWYASRGVSFDSRFEYDVVDNYGLQDELEVEARA